MAFDPSESPLFSVITVTYNALPGLQRTVEAFQRQSFRNFEHIIVDGDSRDGTADWLAEVDHAQIRCISEPDKGLYDAMNKGLGMARGQWVWFVNAGDEPFDPSTLTMLSSLTDGADALYAEVMVVEPGGRELGTRSELTTQRLPDVLDWRSLKLGMMVSHQGFLVRREIAPHYILDNLCADIDWMIRSLQVSHRVVRVHGIIARFETGGISTSRKRRSLVDRYKVLNHHFGFWPNLWAHGIITIRALFHRIWKAIGWPHSSA